MHCRDSYESEQTRGAGDKRGGRGKDKTVGNRDRRSVEGRGIRRGTRGKQNMDTTGTFRSLRNRELSGRKAENLKVGLGWINRGRKDQGFWMGEI